ncbi:MAG: hypothetical protein H0W08_26525 [Acidobacteria bacterium]|nr:hypothetical protein [Acidobacteriota bacterium]
MRRLIVSEFVTLDGVMRAPGDKDEDRDGGFDLGGWTLPYWHDTVGRGKRVFPDEMRAAFELKSATP